MGKSPNVADRLRAFVRGRVRRDGVHYQRGVGARLAEHLDKPTSWVSEYADPDATHLRHADVDTALAICEFFGVNLYDFMRRDEPTETRRPTQTAVQREAQKIAAMWPQLPDSFRTHLRALMELELRGDDAASRRRESAEDNTSATSGEARRASGQRRGRQ